MTDEKNCENCLYWDDSEGVCRHIDECIMHNLWEDMSEGERR